MIVQYTSINWTAIHFENKDFMVSFQTILRYERNREQHNTLQAPRHYENKQFVLIHAGFK